jgi:hypothetical protein
MTPTGGAVAVSGSFSSRECALAEIPCPAGENAGLRNDAIVGLHALVDSRLYLLNPNGVIPNGAVFQAERGISKSTDPMFIRHRLDLAN